MHFFIFNKAFMKKITVFILLFTALANTVMVQARQPSKDAYDEELTRYRIQFEDAKNYSPPVVEHKKKKKINPVCDITEQLNVLLDSMTIAHQKIKYIAGYTIQVYAGNSRALALEAKNKLYTLYPSARPAMSYHQPHYVVSIGHFLDKLEAQKIYAEIKRVLPHAIIRPTRFHSQPNMDIW